MQAIDSHAFYLSFSEVATSIDLSPSAQHTSEASVTYMTSYMLNVFLLSHSFLNSAIELLYRLSVDAFSSKTGKYET
jgi:hypothetical protein